MKIFNSGAILRRSDLEAIGGFPQDFPLDFLDHATFHRLQDRGGRTYLMDSTLQHNLSSLSVDLVREFSTSRRTQMIINAESRFYLRYGSPRDVVIYFLRRGKLFMRMMIAGQPRSACAVLRQTFFPS
jgi:GT2 family glycosyltransferase